MLGYGTGSRNLARILKAFTVHLLESPVIQDVMLPFVRQMIC